MIGLRSRFEFRPGTHRPRHMRNGAIVVALFIGALYYGYSGGKIPFLGQGGRTVRAEFASAANVRPGKTPVRVRGVPVGEVTAVQRAPTGNGVIVTMNITNPGVHLSSNARADIYWRTLLGFGFYIQLDPGSSSSPLGGQLIPVSRTSVQVELDQVLSALTPPSRRGIQTTMHQFAIGFGPHSQAGAAIDALAPAMRNVGPGVSALRGTTPGDITTTVQSSNRLLTALANSDMQLGDLVGQADTTLGVTAGRQSDIASTLQQGPQTLSETQATMTKLNGLLDRLDPVAEALRPGARELLPAARALEPALVELRPLLDDARPTLAALRPALSSLGRAADTGVPLLSALLPAFGRLNAAIIPALQARDTSTQLRLFESVGPTAATVASSASLYDANGHTQRFQAVAGGANTPSFLPCSLNLSAYKLNCSDLEAVIGSLLGLPSASVRGSSRDATATRAR
jgi:phospholipid/cholesterol/gamma-HCH transport system substrate-binding protein